MKNRYKILLINDLLIIFCFVILDYIAYRMLKNETPHEQDKNANYFLLMSKIFIVGKNKLKKKYKDIKFVIIRYRIKDDNENDDLMETPYLWNYLEKQGFIILDTESLIGRKYKNNSEDTTSDGKHPSEKVWNELTPIIIEKLQL